MLLTTRFTSIKNTLSKLLLSYDHRNHFDEKLVEFINEWIKIDLDLFLYEYKRTADYDMAAETMKKLRDYNSMMTHGMLYRLNMK